MRLQRKTLVVFVTLCLLFAASTLSAYAAGSNATFRLIPPVNTGTFPHLAAVSMSSTTDAWAVGNTSNASNSASFTLAEHWNGQNWQVVPTPNPSGISVQFTAVADLSPTSAWAIGSSLDSTNTHSPLIEHFNGRAWSIVPPAADNGAIQPTFNAIAGASANDVWITGSHEDLATSTLRGFTEHWNGSAWSFVPVPAGVTGVGALSVVSSNDIWAAAATNANPSPFMHWNGSAWSLVPAPAITSRDPAIQSITGISATDAWAVGFSAAGRFDPVQSLIEHWDGKSWKIVPSPAGLVGNNFPWSVAAVSSNDVWAVFSQSATAAHWDGSAWSLVQLPVPSGSQFNILNAVAAVHTGTVIAAGRSDNGIFAILSSNA
jgi:hypothetical protein